MTTPEWFVRLRTFEHSAVHLETLSYYHADLEAFDAWRAGTLTTTVHLPDFAAWQELVRSHTAEGRSMARVRILDEPPTEYQRFEIWLSQWNELAGESVRAISRSRAEEVGLMPAGFDFWVLDERTLLVMAHDEQGLLGEVPITTDRGRVAAALDLWHLALANSEPNPIDLLEQHR